MRSTSPHRFLESESAPVTLLYSTCPNCQLKNSRLHCYARNATMLAKNTRLASSFQYSTVDIPTWPIDHSNQIRCIFFLTLDCMHARMHCMIVGRVNLIEAPLPPLPYIMNMAVHSNQCQCVPPSPSPPRMHASARMNPSDSPSPSARALRTEVDRKKENSA